MDATKNLINITCQDGTKIRVPSAKLVALSTLACETGVSWGNLWRMLSAHPGEQPLPRPRPVVDA